MAADDLPHCFEITLRCGGLFPFFYGRLCSLYLARRLSAYFFLPFMSIFDRMGGSGPAPDTAKSDCFPFQGPMSCFSFRFFSPWRFHVSHCVSGCVAPPPRLLGRGWGFVSPRESRGITTLAAAGVGPDPGRYWRPMGGLFGVAAPRLLGNPFAS